MKGFMSEDVDAAFKAGLRSGRAEKRDADFIPVGAVEIADRLGVLPQTVAQWRQRGLLPAPEWTVGGRPAWAWSTIEAWATETGRI